MSDEGSVPEPLTGAVEVDETYVGGKPRKPRHPREKWTDKTPVAAIVQRGGDVRAAVMPQVNAKNLKAMIRENVHPSTNIYTDEASWYRGLDREYASHETVVHANGEYARGNVTTNRAEGFFSLLKRGTNGSYHAVSKKHLHRYVSEFQYRWNTRDIEDGARTVKLIQKGVGKRLMYREPIQKITA